ncbi:thioredoxin TrxC [candidate division CSSED10-310 bacterium]|uniref:Thioredoxin n=1 Tax=candidate division CSSED10-310 bacterium TaxID=2855610 RepID=A0ABV6YXC4_UNCC1
MSKEPIILKCPACGTRNRIPYHRLQSAANCGSCKKTLPQITSHPVNVTSARFAEEVLQAPMPVLVDFWAAWCGPCRMIAPDLEKIALDYAGRIKVAKVDSDQNQDLSGKYGIQAIPTLLVFNNGQLIERQTGALPLPQLQSLVEKVTRT